MSDIINQTVLITDAKVIYYIGTAIRANGDLPLITRNDNCTTILGMSFETSAKCSREYVTGLPKIYLFIKGLLSILIFKTGVFIF